MAELESLFSTAKCISERMGTQEEKKKMNMERHKFGQKDLWILES